MIKRLKNFRAIQRQSLLAFGWNFKNKSIAEDALQDSFVKVYFALSTFKGESSFSTWIYSIVFNTGLTYAKRKNF